MKSGTRGLPGFLRRTRRSDFLEEDSSEEEEDKEDKEKNADIRNRGNIDRETTNGKSKEESLNRTTDASSERKKGADDSESDVIDKSISKPLRVASMDSFGPQFENGMTSSTPKDDEISALGASAAHLDSSNDSIRSSSSVHSTLQPPKASYREIQFQKVLNAPVVKLPELRKLAWNGIPAEYRGMSWKLLLGYLPTNQARRTATLQRKRAEYRDAMNQHYHMDDNARTLQEQETLRQVLVDVPRTAPEIPLFRNDKIKRALGRLLYVWAMRHPASSYVQGINDLATPLFAVFVSDLYQGKDALDGKAMLVLSDERLDEIEADVYWCLTNILAGIQDHYTADQPGVQRMVMRLEELVQRIDTPLCEHLEATGILFLQFAFKWMNCLLLREFHLKCVVRLWDTYLAEDNNTGFEDFHVYVCAAFLCQFSPQMQGMGFDELFQFMQNVPTEDWEETEIEMLLSQAYVLSTLFGGSEAHLLASAGNSNRNLGMGMS